MISRADFLEDCMQPVDNPTGVLSCPICEQDPPVDLIRLPCHETHVYCRDCAMEWLKQPRVNNCPHCRTTLFELTQEERDAEDDTGDLSDDDDLESFEDDYDALDYYGASDFDESEEDIIDQSGEDEEDSISLDFEEDDSVDEDGEEGQEDDLEQVYLELDARLAAGRQPVGNHLRSAARRLLSRYQHVGEFDRELFETLGGASGDSPQPPSSVAAAEEDNVSSMDDDEGDANEVEARANIIARLKQKLEELSRGDEGIHGVEDSEERRGSFIGSTLLDMQPPTVSDNVSPALNPL